ncbi:recombinase family protein [Bradyrhizobium sp. AZCC 2289]|uniref:recombinase family protein n=1 Tax=Bradyrhizobium sp. AZCC 2289 TaxID=3117026 RepID=UPI002FEFB70A
MNAPVRAETKTLAYSYVRFSTPSQAAGASLQRQTEKAAKYALDHGLTLDTELNMTDLGVSAYRGKNAHTGALGGFLKAVDAGYVERGSYLLIENMDRLSRADIVTAQGLFLQLVGSGINLVTLTNGEAYSAERFQREPEAIFLVVLELIRANKESVRKGQLIGDAKARKKQRLAEHGLEGKPYTRQDDIPAIVFNGSLDEAVREALRRNTKNQLPMTPQDRREAAWRLVKEGKPGEWPDSISETQALSGAGKGTVDRMRAAWTKLHSGQYGDLKDIEGLSWSQAQSKLKGTGAQAFDEDSWLEGRAQNLAAAIDRAKLHLSKDIEVTALALEMLDPQLPAALMAHWAPPRRFDPHAVDEDELDEDGEPLPF